MKIGCSRVFALDCFVSLYGSARRFIARFAARKQRFLATG